MMQKQTRLALALMAAATTACGGGRMKAPSGEIEPVEAPGVLGVDDISVNAVNATPSLQMLKSESGPVVARAQILLDRARFSVGVINGKATKNTALAIQWFQKSQNLPATSMLDSATYARLISVAGPVPPVIQVVVDADLVSGPFIEMPHDVYQQANSAVSAMPRYRKKSPSDSTRPSRSCGS